jgi:hypothetical protein
MFGTLSIFTYAPVQHVMPCSVLAIAQLEASVTLRLIDSVYINNEIMNANLAAEVADI